MVYKVQAVSVGQVVLSYRRWGDPADPALVLLHALGEDASGWDPVAAGLAEARCVYALDLRGHGESAHTDRYSLELMCDDVIGLLDRLGLRQITLIGHSMGGMVACLVATRRGTLLDRLVLEETPPPLPAAPPRSVPDRPTEPAAFDWAAVRAIYDQRNAPDPAWWDALATISVPTLVLAGGPESHVPQDQLSWLTDQIPGARLVTIDAGHHVHTMRPAEFIEAVVRFLRG